MSEHDLRHEIPGDAVRGAAGFFGVAAAILFLPRLIRFTARQYLFRMLAEIVAIVTLGLLTEKFARWISREASPQTPVSRKVDRAPVAEPVAENGFPA